MALVRRAGLVEVFGEPSRGPDPQKMALGKEAAAKSPLTQSQRNEMCVRNVKSKMKYPQTFEMGEVMPEMSDDGMTITYAFQFTARNAFNVPADHFALCHFDGK